MLPAIAKQTMNSTSRARGDFSDADMDLSSPLRFCHGGYKKTMKRILGTALAGLAGTKAEIPRPEGVATPPVLPDLA
jgi:hypothetical protein